MDTSLFCRSKDDNLCVDENTYQEQLEESNSSLEKSGVTIESTYEMKTKKSTQIYTVNVDKVKKADYSTLGIPKDRNMKTFLKQLEKVGYSCDDE